MPLVVSAPTISETPFMGFISTILAIFYQQNNIFFVNPIYRHSLIYWMINYVQMIGTNCLLNRFYDVCLIETCSRDRHLKKVSRIFYQYDANSLQRESFSNNWMPKQRDKSHLGMINLWSCGCLNTRLQLY